MNDTQTLGRTLKLYLANGSPNGLIVAELGNWSGKILKSPRSKLHELINRKEASQTGIYLLMGDDPEYVARKLIYVGESDELNSRLTKHDKDDGKGFFTRICIIVSKDENLTKSHVRYLEYRLINIIKDGTKASLFNKNIPKQVKLPESDVADMNRFLAEIQILLPILGFDVFSPISETSKTTVKKDLDSQIFKFDKSGIKAKACEIDGDFVVLANSFARIKETASIQKYAKEFRNQLLVDGILVQTEKQGAWRFTKNVPFDSPSGAASVVYGGNLSGPESWIAENGQTYKQWRETKLKSTKLEDVPA